MLIVHAHNVTGGNGTAPDGTADYDVKVCINERVIWRGPVTGHTRADGAAELFRKLADCMDSEPHKVARK